MSERKTPWLTALIGILAVAAVAAVGSWRRRPEHGCALDGSKIDSIYRVEVIDREGIHNFCCITCARLWIQRHPNDPPRAVKVTDEATGDPIDAGKAVYVQSTVVTTPITQNRIHAFGTRENAEKHAAKFGGVVESNSPFSP